MKYFCAVICVFILSLPFSSLWADEPPSKEMLIEMVRVNSLEAIAKNDVISVLNQGDKDLARQRICENLEANLQSLKWLSEYVSDTDADIVGRTVSYVASSSADCDFSTEISLFLEPYS